MGNSRDTSSEEGKYNEGMGLSESLSTMQRVTAVLSRSVMAIVHIEEQNYSYSFDLYCTYRFDSFMEVSSDSYRLIVFVVEGTHSRV
eukprot:scaffold201422_cov56-Attheya_sp.AAC.1